jgi:ParB family chromosome partitioning protein
MAHELLFLQLAKLAELANNIRQHGVLQPVLLRPLPEGEAGTFELVARTRCFRASKLAKRESIPQPRAN